MTDRPTLNEWIARIDRERLTDTLLRRGAWHGYTAAARGEAPMRGEYFIVRWARPTVAVSHDDPDECLRLAGIIERALAAEPPSAEALAYAHAAKVLAGSPMTSEQVEKIRREWVGLHRGQLPTVLSDPIEQRERAYHRADGPEPAERGEP